MRTRLAAGIAAVVMLVQAVPASAVGPGHHHPEPPHHGGPLHSKTNRWVGSAVAAQHLSAEADYKKVLTREFDSVTPENEMKWGTVEAVRGQYDWSGADAIVDYAKKTGKSIRGHTLIWHSQLPDWVADLEAAELKSVVRKHIADEAGRYRGKIRAWDVVNEAFNEDGTRRETVFQTKLGDDYIADAFRLAHAADPKAKLYINDYNIEGLNPKSDATYELVKSLKRKGVPIHGVGIQGHLSLMYDFPQGVKENIKRFADLGVDVAITEMDVRIPLPVTPEKLKAQADYFGNVWDACHAVKRCVEFTTWGFTDRHSWVPDVFPGEDAACLFDENLKPKPAYFRLYGKK
ncbi:endo-1,4-beta-xylanase [Lentzea fradiae]|uniref:Beta-xylanase n=1 Tax=Lentzea fradiae TaxID=200378 RepID=A0A1G7VKI3_9PSEU|nr:endo-1,4-beta-xylanase [Lentzea fradiae]SDG60315.1 endo-1,4-beta-xylanase [Lentzea fradiae]